MYFDALEKRSFEELYQVHADDFYTSFIQDTCSDTRLKNVLLRNGTLTLRDLLMSSPQKVFGYYGFGRLTAMALKEYLDKMVAASNGIGSEAQASSNTTPPNERLINNTESSAKQMKKSENKSIPPLEPLIVDIVSSGSVSVQEHQIERSAPRTIPLIRDNPQEIAQQPYASSVERSSSSSQKGKNMDALLSYIGWLAPDSVETVKKLLLLFAMIDTADEKGVSSHERIKDAFLARSNISLSDPVKEAMEITTLPAFKALSSSGYIYSVIRMGQEKCVKFQRPLCDELIEDEYRQLRSCLQEKLKTVDTYLRQVAAPKTRTKSRSPLEKLAARLNSEIFRKTYLGDIQINEEEYFLLKEYLRCVVRGEKTQFEKLNRPLFSVAVVQVGMRCYRNGNFWTNFFREIDSDDYIKKISVQQNIGDLFVSTLLLYRKACCGENEYVSNVLLHTFVSNYYSGNYFDFLYRFYSYDLDRDIARLDRQMLNDLVDSICSEEKKNRTYLLVQHTADAIRSNRTGGKIRIRNHLKRIDYLFWNETQSKPSHRILGLMQAWSESSLQFTNEARISRVTFEHGARHFYTPYLQRNPSTGECCLQFPSQSIRECDTTNVRWIVSGAVNDSVPVELTESVLGYRVLPTSIDIPQETLLQAYRCDLVDGAEERLRSFLIPAERVRMFDLPTGYPLNNRNLKVGEVVALSQPKDTIYSSALYYSELEKGLLASFFHFEFEDIVRLPDNRAVIIGKKILENGLIGGGLIENTVCLSGEAELALYSRPPYLVLRMQESKSVGTGLIINGTKSRLFDHDTVPFAVDDMSGETGYYVNLTDFCVNKDGKYDISVDIPGGTIRSWSFVLCNNYHHTFENGPYIYEPKGTIIFSDNTPIVKAEGDYHKEKGINAFEFNTNQPDRKLHFSMSLDNEIFSLIIPIPALYIKRADGTWQCSKPQPIWHTELPDVLEVSVPYHKIQLELDRSQEESDESEIDSENSILEYRKNNGATSILCEIRKLKSYFTGEPPLRNILFKFGNTQGTLLQVLTRSIVSSCRLYGEFKKNQIHVSADIIGKAEYCVDILLDGIAVCNKAPLTDGHVVIQLPGAIPKGDYNAIIYEIVRDDSGFDLESYNQIATITQELINPYDMNGKNLRIVSIISLEDVNSVFPVSFDYRLENLIQKEGNATYSGKMIVLDRSKKGRAVAAYPAIAMFTDIENPSTITLSFPDDEYGDEELFLYDTRRHAILKNANPSIKKTEQYRRYVVLDSDQYVFSIEFSKPCGLDVSNVPHHLILPELNYFHGTHWAPSRQLKDLLPDIDFKGYTSIDQLALLTKTQCASILQVEPDSIQQIGTVLHGFGLAFKAEPQQSVVFDYPRAALVTKLSDATQSETREQRDFASFDSAPAKDNSITMHQEGEVQAAMPKEDESAKPLSSGSVKDMGLRPYVYNCLLNGGVKTIDDLQRLVDRRGKKGLLQIRNCTSAMAEEILDALRYYTKNRGTN